MVSSSVKVTPCSVANSSTFDLKESCLLSTSLTSFSAVSYVLLASLALSHASSKDSVKASTTFTTPKIAPAARIAQPTGLVSKNVANPAAAAFKEAARPAVATAAIPFAVAIVPAVTAAAASAELKPVASKAAIIVDSPTP